MSHSTNDVLQKISDPEDAEKARSLLDLIELNTVDLELAAWLVSLVSRGASYITGSGPGGIGKHSQGLRGLRITRCWKSMHGVCLVFDNMPKPEASNPFWQRVRSAGCHSDQGP